MIAERCQRWRGGRGRYRPAGEVIVPSRHEVSEISSDEVARAFVERHHYSRSFPAARRRFGLYERGELVGVAVLSHPMHDQVTASVFPGVPRLDAAELGRFVLLDRVAGNGESWFLARVWELLAGELAGVVMYSDPVARQDSQGRSVMPGHVGVIYQATNATYLGRGRGGAVYVLPDGSVFSRRTAQKISGGERGFRPAMDLLVRHGAPEPGFDLSSVPLRKEWLKVALAACSRKVMHPGNHKYAWGIDRRVRRRLPESLPYPRAPS